MPFDGNNLLYVDPKPAVETKPEAQTEIGRIINLVADYISENGWTQGVYRNQRGEVCILGALHSLKLPIIMEAKVSLALQKICATTVDNYNDRILHSKAEAIRFLREAAALENGYNLNRSRRTNRFTYVNSAGLRDYFSSYL